MSHIFVSSTESFYITGVIINTYSLIKFNQLIFSDLIISGLKKC